MIPAALVLRRGARRRAAVMAGLLLAPAWYQARSGGKKVEPVVYEWDEESKQLSPPVKPIHPAVRPSAIPRALPAGVAAYPRLYANQELNSRTVRGLPAGNWAVAWRAALNPEFGVGAVLQDGDYVLVESGEWRLFDRTGRFIASDRLGLGPMLLDAANGLFYQVDSAGYVVARRLADGGSLFRFLPSFGDRYERSFLARRGDQMLVAGIERARDPHGRKPPKDSLVEAPGLGHPVQVDDMGYLQSSKDHGVLRFPTLHLLTAAHGGVIVCALHDRIYLLDWNLQIGSALEGSFEPQSLSLDEAGRIYAIVESGERIALWVLTQQGERLSSFELPAGIASVSFAPIVGYDHTVYVLAGQTIFSVAMDGKLNWSRTASGNIAGAVVIPDDQLLVTEGGQVVLRNARGERQVVCALPEGLSTPPVITAAGELLVASPSALYCLRAQP